MPFSILGFFQNKELDENVGMHPLVLEDLGPIFVIGNGGCFERGHTS